MSHEIYDNKVISYRKPMWHHLGHVIEEQLNATDAYDRVGKYRVEMVPLRFDNGQDTGLRAIVRDYGTQEQALFGTVGQGYHLVTPEDICQAWDDVVERHIETLGALREGSVFFVSTHLGSSNILGDELEDYLLLSSPMSGMESISAMVTKVRTVCMNTLMAAKRQATDTFTIPHNKMALERTRMWLGYLIQKAQAHRETQQEVFTRFAQHRPTPAQVDHVLEETFPLPELNIRGIVDDTTRKNREKWNEEYRRAAQGARTRSRELFEGKGTGMDHPAADGTFWGLYNAIVEDRDYGNLRLKKLEARARDTLFGIRANEKERAYVTIDRLITSGEAKKTKVRGANGRFVAP